jgi:hypothetical protein
MLAKQVLYCLSHTSKEILDYSEYRQISGTQRISLLNYCAGDISKNEMA